MELYHVLNRGVDKRTIFLDGVDYARFVHDLWEFNDVHDAKNVWYRAGTFKGLRNPNTSKERIVDLHGWRLMKNHYHLLVSERYEGSLTKFIRRLNIGYANYFNDRYNRKGTLFQGRTKKILIKSDAHFLHILNYLHSNPLDFLRSAKDWRTTGVHSVARAIDHVTKYKWSSYLDYVGESNFPSILTTSLFMDIFGDYKKELRGFVRDREARHLSDYRLEY